jgi:hypothetical protein
MIDVPMLPPVVGYEPETKSLLPSGDHAAQQPEDEVSRNMTRLGQRLSAGPKRQGTPENMPGEAL